MSSSALFPPSPVRLRPATEADAPPLCQLWAAAFPGERTAEERLEALNDNTGPYGGLENCWVGEAEGRMVGGLRTYPLTLHLWGLPFRTQGLAAVAVSPEARRQGVGGAMCQQALTHGRASGDLLSALYPFRTDFYARMGFTLAGEYHRYRFPPEELPLFPEGQAVRALTREEAQAQVPAFYERMLARTNGLISRNPRLWKHLSEDGIRVLAVSGDSPDTLAGFMTVRLTPYRRPEDARLVVRELLAESLPAYRGLLGWLSAQRDQWREVVHDALPGEAFHQLLGHPRKPGARPVRSLWFPSGTLVRGPMLRILDLPGVLDHVGFPEGATLGVDDPILPENGGQWTRKGGQLQRGDGASGDGVSGDGVPGGGLPPRVVTELLVSGTLPGLVDRAREWEPALGLTDFRLWDAF